MTYGSGSFSGKYLLSSPIRFKLTECRKFRYRVHRPSYNHHRACHHQAINWCCINSKLPTLLSSNHSLLVPTLVNRFRRRRWYHWVSYTRTSKHRCQPPHVSIGPVDLTLGQLSSHSKSPMVVISHVLCRYFESCHK